LSKLIIADGIVLVKLNSIQRRLLKRPHIAFELGRLMAIYVQKSPKRRDLGEKVTKRGFLWSKTGEYRLGVKTSLYLGRSRGKVVRILLLNPAFDELILGIGKPQDVSKLLTPYLKKSDFSQK
jgi:hypothetical protein